MTDINAGFRKTDETNVIERDEKRRKKIVKYVFLTACGIVLYRVGSVLALAERGYEATGGEILLPLFPFLCSAIVTMIKDAIRDAKAHTDAGKDENDHE